MRLLWFRAVISCEEGDYLSIAKHLLKDIRLALRTLVLGETENVRFHIGPSEREAVHVLNLTQTRWHKLVRLLTGRASFYRRWIGHHHGHAELSPNVLSDLGKTMSIGTEPSATPNVQADAPPSGGRGRAQS